jgi:dTDP-glucose 4,6-dehydratase
MKEGEGMVFDPLFDQKRFVIAGGSGFIGQNLCKRFLSRGHKVVSWDRNTTNGHHPCSREENFDRKNKNISNFYDCYDEKPINFILHFASHVSPRDFLKHPGETLLSNSQGTHNLLSLAKDKSARFLFASSARVYRGDDPTHPRGVYEQAKRFGEAMIATWQKEGMVDARIVRMYQTYGPGCRLDDGHVIPTFIRAALKNETISVLGGGQWTSFTYIDDMIDGIQAVLYSDEKTPVDLGNRDQVRIDWLARTIVKLCKSKSAIDAELFNINNERPPDLKKATSLGWKPKVRIEDGLVMTIEDFKNRL